MSAREIAPPTAVLNGDMILIDLNSPHPKPPHKAPEWLKKAVYLIVTALVKALTAYIVNTALDRMTN